MSRRRRSHDILADARAAHRPLSVAEFRQVTAPPPPSEHDEQVRFVAWARSAENRYPDLGNLAGIPNQAGRDQHRGGKGALIRQAKMKAEGLAPGFPDLLLMVARGGFHGWACEMKSARGRVSEAQAAWHERLRTHGYCVVVCYGADEARDAVLHYLSLPRTE